MLFNVKQLFFAIDFGMNNKKKKICYYLLLMPFSNNFNNITLTIYNKIKLSYIIYIMSCIFLLFIFRRKTSSK